MKGLTYFAETSINMASHAHGAKVIVGYNGEELLNDNTTIYNEKNGNYSELQIIGNSYTYTFFFCRIFVSQANHKQRGSNCS